MEKTKHIDCSCSCETLKLVCNEDGEVDLSIWKTYNDQPSFWNRFRLIWHTLKSGKPYYDQIVLGKKEIKQLYSFTQDFLGLKGEHAKLRGDVERVYIAGAYSGDNIMEILGNIRRGIKKAAEMISEDVAPFCPWLDYQFAFFNPDLTIKALKAYSMVWLEVSTRVYVLKNSEHSTGTQDEIKRAKELGIPVEYE